MELAHVTQRPSALNQTSGLSRYVIEPFEDRQCFLRQLYRFLPKAHPFAHVAREHQHLGDEIRIPISPPIPPRPENASKEPFAL